eukprot:756596-Hanusia_phi.AAC.2
MEDLHDINFYSALRSVGDDMKGGPDLLESGVAVGNNGVILSTWNGGANWQLNQDFSNHLYGVHIFQPLAVGDAGKVIYTDNGGDTWNQLAQIEAVDAQGVKFFPVLTSIRKNTANSCTMQSSSA